MLAGRWTLIKERSKESAERLLFILIGWHTNEKNHHGKPRIKTGNVMKKLDAWLLEELTDKKFAHAFLETEANARFAAQVRMLRKTRGWTQHDLATASGLAESVIAEIELGRPDGLQLVLLRKLARAFDVHLSLKLESAISGASDIVRYAEAELDVPTREAELRAYGVYTVLPPTPGIENDG
ncbi:helix-turn-helix domain-containing protein [Ralstonia mannitolilytica]|uniref:helix-turn-helix domain-containing protein n=1 Tax=Ralstonia mannitolilytica TaxID=105219 RepID=UPI003B83D399